MNSIEKRLERLESLVLPEEQLTESEQVINFSVKPALVDVKITRSGSRETIPAGESTFPEDEPAFSLIVGKPRRRKGKYKPGETLFRGAKESLNDFTKRVKESFNKIHNHNERCYHEHVTICTK
jgi:hypothetical protein